MTLQPPGAGRELLAVLELYARMKLVDAHVALTWTLVPLPPLLLITHLPD